MKFSMKPFWFLFGVRKRSAFSLKGSVGQSDSFGSGFLSLGRCMGKDLDLEPAKKKKVVLDKLLFYEQECQRINQLWQSKSAMTFLFSLFMGSPFFAKRVSNVLLRNFCGQKEKEGLEDNSVPILDNLVER